MYQKVRSNLTTTRQDGELKGGEGERYSSIRNIDDLSYEDNFPKGNLLFPEFHSSEDVRQLAKITVITTKFLNYI
jgi:hypothetical protein